MSQPELFYSSARTELVHQMVCAIQLCLVNINGPVAKQNYVAPLLVSHHTTGGPAIPSARDVPLAPLFGPLCAKERMRTRPDEPAICIEMKLGDDCMASLKWLGKLLESRSSEVTYSASGAIVI
jgi:hypothetical protein